jgi:glucose-6-phosphate 1-dehydrogenase
MHLFSSARAVISPTATEVIVELKQPPQTVFDESQPCEPNYFRFRISPDVLISVGTRIKRPGDAMVGEAAELIAHQHSGENMTPYARLLGDALRGDGSLFTRMIASRQHGASSIQSSRIPRRSSSTSPTRGDRPKPSAS